MPTSAEPPHSPADHLLDDVTQVVARVILEQTGRSVRPAPDEPLIARRYLDRLALTSLALALQDRFAVLFSQGDLEYGLGSIREIATRVKRLSDARSRSP
ncbi:MAG: hypothetical protein AAF628_21435 [Planctomycetota bacterium]